MNNQNQNDTTGDLQMIRVSHTDQNGRIHTGTTTPRGDIAVVIDEAGKLTLIEWQQMDEDQELNVLRSATGGGWVQLVQLEQDLDIWVDEDARLRDVRRNEVATRFASVRRTLAAPLLGKAIVTGGVSPEGLTRPLGPTQAVQVLAELSSAGGIITATVRCSTLLATSKQ